MEERWCTNSKMHYGTAKYIVEGEVCMGTRLQNADNFVYLRSQNIEAWMVKPLSAVV